MSVHRRRHARPSASRGFTLLELGIVIGVSAILAAAIVPDLVEAMRNRMAERAAADVAALHDAARLYYVQNTGITRLKWPGEQNGGACVFNPPGPSAAVTDLLQGGYLAGGGGAANPLVTSLDFMRNPWGQRYEATLYAPVVLVGSPACLFGIATDVPTAIRDGFISFLPMAACGAACPMAAAGATPAGFARCCSYVPKPGATITGPCPANQTPQNIGGALRCAP